MPTCNGSRLKSVGLAFNAVLGSNYRCLAGLIARFKRQGEMSLDLQRRSQSGSQHINSFRRQDGVGCHVALRT